MLVIDQPIKKIRLEMCSPIFVAMKPSPLFSLTNNEFQRLGANDLDIVPTSHFQILVTSWLRYWSDLFIIYEVRCMEKAHRINPYKLYDLSC